MSNAFGVQSDVSTAIFYIQVLILFRNFVVKWKPKFEFPGAIEPTSASIDKFELLEKTLK